MALKTWTYAALLMVVRLSGGYRHKYMLTPHQEEVSSNENSDYYPTLEYHRWHSVSNTTRSENSTLKIINIAPLPYNRHGVQTAPPQKITQKSESRDEIIFPEPPARHQHGSFTFQVPKSCLESGSSICTDVPNYPEEYIDNMLRNSAEEWHPTSDQLENEIKINQRIGDDPDEIQLCESYENIEYPKVAQTKDRKWLPLINTARFTQGLRVELCSPSKSSCNSAATFRYGMVASCKQKFVLRELKAIDSSGQVVTEYFRIPSCCTCVVRYDTNAAILS